MLDQNHDYWQKILEPNFDDIFWNIPEQKTGKIQIIGGNSQNFAYESRIAEFISSLNIKQMRLLLPDALSKKLPPIPGIDFAPSTNSGSFDKSEELESAFNDSDLVFLSGDFSKNAETSIALTEALKKSQKPVVIARDTIGSVTEGADDFIEKENLILIASMLQLQKLLHSILYPRMVLLSDPILPIIETIHKFTLSFPLVLFTFHANQIIIAKDGKVLTIPIDHTSYTSLSLLTGNLPGKIAALNLWTPTKPLEATAAAVFWNEKEKMI